MMTVGYNGLRVLEEYVNIKSILMSSKSPNNARVKTLDDEICKYKQATKSSPHIPNLQTNKN